MRTMPAGVKKIFLTKLTDVKTVDVEGIGTLRWEGNKCYKWITYSEEAAAVDGVAGEVTFYTVIDGYKLHEVTSDLTASGNIGGGVLQAIMSDGEFGWIQIKGAATLTIALSDGTDDSPQTPLGGNDGTLDINIATAANEDICAWSGDASDKEIICDFMF